ncbi:MAG: type II secretion system F family protein [Singulisphaera sp.]|nr:type II secretion system F family protein [Singulisphaera sp.]
MTIDGEITLIVFSLTSSAFLLVYTLVVARRTRLDRRLEEIGSGRDLSDSIPQATSMAQFTQATLPRMGAPLIPTEEEERTLLQARLIHAGYYGRQAMAIFLGVKLLLIVGPTFIGLALGVLGILPMRYAVLGGTCLGIGGMIGPSFWLDSQKKKRQTNFRRALPDALDVLVISMEGGLSLPGGLRKISTELRTAHPALAAELNLVQREVQLGRSPGEALMQLGTRTDLEEIRNLASVITQAERYGASLVKSLRVHAETLRLKRYQRAEEMAQKATIKIMFPTLLFIFPTVFVVVLAPAVLRFMNFFTQTKIPTIKF